MTESTFFINEGLNRAFLLYDSSKDKEESLDYNSFMCCIIRMLILIYGEEINKSFETKDVNLFEKEVLKYGYSKKEFNNFKLCVDKFYSVDKKTESKAIKKKNKYFNLVQRNSKEAVDKKVMKDFSSLLFTANSKTFYQKSYAVLVAYNPYEIYEYAKKNNIVGDGNEKDNNN